MKSICRAILILGVAASLDGTAPAQGTQGSGLDSKDLPLIHDRDVQRELKLDDQQVERVRKVREEITRMTRERGLSDASLSDELDGKLRGLVGSLKPEQQARLGQIGRQMRWPLSFSDPDIQGPLKLTDHQREEIKKINDEFYRDMERQFLEIYQDKNRDVQGKSRASNEKNRALRTEARARALALLTDEQKATWKALTGEPFQAQGNTPPEDSGRSDAPAGRTDRPDRPGGEEKRTTEGPRPVPSDSGISGSTNKTPTDIASALNRISAALERLEERSGPLYGAPPGPMAQPPGYPGAYIIPPQAPPLAVVAQTPTASPSPGADQAGRSAIGWSVIEIAVIAAILTFAGVVMRMAMRVREQGKISGINFFKLAGMSFVIASGVILIAAGYSQNQTAPMMSILAAIAGYIFGKGEDGDNSRRVEKGGPDLISGGAPSRPEGIRPNPA